MAVEPIATYVLIAVNVLVYFGGSSSSVDFTLSKGDVAAGHVWLLVTSGFMHAGILHLLLNMYALFWLGRMIEPALGHPRFLGIYFAALLCGSLGVLVLEPHANAVGASGAIFGLFGASLVMARNRNISLMQTGLLPVLALNLVITFLPGSHIAYGAHLGGLVGGLLAAFVVEELARRRRASLVPGVAFCVLLGAAAFAGSLLYAG
jgi:membrane associated rhomboid family serine protease